MPAPRLAPPSAPTPEPTDEHDETSFNPDPPQDDPPNGNILTRPADWVQTQVQQILPATRDAVKRFTATPRQRLTLIAALAVTFVIVAGVFLYLLVRRR